MTEAVEHGLVQRAEGEIRFSHLQETLGEAAIDTPVILDYDETLWLRNSTEMYLASARPAALAAFLLCLIDLVRPWKLLHWRDGERRYRDWIRVLAITVLFPWTLPLWRQRAPRLGLDHLNEPLLAAVRASPAQQRWILSNGFGIILRPLLARVEGLDARLVAAPLLGGWAWRALGKRRIAERAVGGEALDRAVFVTDHHADRDLLDRVSQSFLLKWADARFEPAFRDRYAPFDYLNNCKREGQNTFMRDVIGEDLIVVLLAFAVVNEAILGAVLCATLLHLSFWAIYEIGYFDNDRVAAAYEAEPKVPRRYPEYAEKFDITAAWIWAGFFGLAGVAAAGATGVDMALSPASALGLSAGGTIEMLMVWTLWMGGLLAAWWTFWIYNRIDKATRTLLYLPLQIFKYALFALVLPTLVTGVLLIIGQILRAWVPYMVYRYAKTPPKLNVPGRMIRLMVFVTAFGLVLLTELADPMMLALHGLLILAFCTLRAAPQLRDFLAQSYWITADREKAGLGEQHR
ncbi:MAG: hypothetical protein AAF713_12240 [Pseudomonadota bacterium]